MFKHLRISCNSFPLMKFKFSRISVSSIESNSFFGTPITEIILPESITIIPSRLFQSCSYLAKITILGDITEIGQSAFDNCGTLKSIIIPDTTATIGDYCFRYCKVI